MGEGASDPSNISTAVQDRDKLSTITPMFSRFSNTTALWLNLPDLFRSRDSSMTADKVEILITQLLDWIAT